MTETVTSSVPSVEQAIALYAAGYFPMDDPSEASNPLPFYAAHERAIFELDVATREAVRRRVRRSLRVGARWTLDRDTAFDTVVHRCAQPREPDDGVWLTPRLRTLYARLHLAGAAHSFELYAEGELVAGLIAVELGRAAMLESMAHWRSHAGNVLFARTLDALAVGGVELCDIQLPTLHTTRLGATLIPRAAYEARLLQVLS